MSEQLKLGTRVKITRGPSEGSKGTVVKVLEDGSYRVYLDVEDDTFSFFRSELEVFVQPDVKMIHRRFELEELRARLGLRNDWHEPDEREITVEVRGRSFDNAGFWGIQNEDLAGKNHEELHVVLRQDGEPVAMVNLATLFAFATGYEG